MITSMTTTVRGRTVRVARGGVGSAMLLVHGGWGGAELHWRSVWDGLAARHDVIAPDLPGLGDVQAPPLASVADYARWLVELLDALAVDRAVCVGNSFGASVAWSLAGRFPARCAGLILVDGFPMPSTPRPLQWLGRRAGMRGLTAALVGRLIYTEANLPRAFADVGKVPAALRRAIADAWPLIVPRYVDILIAGDGAPAPRVTPSLIWGARDRLPGSTSAAAARWNQRVHASQLRMIAGAGHFPQIEAPAAFVAAVEEAARAP